MPGVTKRERKPCKPLHTWWIGGLYVLLPSADVDEFHAAAARKTVPTHARTNSAGIGDVTARTWKEDEQDNELDAYVRISTVGIAFSNWTCSTKCVPNGRRATMGQMRLQQTEGVFCTNERFLSRFGLPNKDNPLTPIALPWGGYQTHVEGRTEYDSCFFRQILSVDPVIVVL
jgi:hypothetical protein